MFFIFNNIIYKQIYGISDGVIFVTNVANMVMQDLKEIAIAMLPVRLLFYYRYVDN